MSLFFLMLVYISYMSDPSHVSPPSSDSSQFILEDCCVASESSCLVFDSQIQRWRFVFLITWCNLIASVLLPSYNNDLIFWSILKALQTLLLYNNPHFLLCVLLLPSPGDMDWDACFLLLKGNQSSWSSKCSWRWVFIRARAYCWGLHLVWL